MGLHTALYSKCSLRRQQTKAHSLASHSRVAWPHQLPQVHCLRYQSTWSSQRIALLSMQLTQPVKVHKITQLPVRNQQIRKITQRSQLARSLLAFSNQTRMSVLHPPQPLTQEQWAVMVHQDRCNSHLCIMQSLASCKMRDIISPMSAAPHPELPSKVGNSVEKLQMLMPNQYMARVPRSNSIRMDKTQLYYLQ